MNFSRYLGSAGIWVVLAAGAVSPAQADVVTFSWSPSAIGLTNNGTGGAGFTDIVNANDYNIADFAASTITTSTGAFTETGYLNILNFLHDGTTVDSFGLGKGVAPLGIPGYSLYLAFSGAGLTTPLPTITGTASNGIFTSLNYTLIGSASGAPPLSFTVSNGTVTANDPGPIQILGYGSLVPGTGIVTTTKTANGYSPTANANLTFNQCGPAFSGPCTADESAFFLAPTLGLNLQVGNFSATDTRTSLSSGGPDTEFLDIAGGGGNLTFITPAPEPASAGLLGSGLVGLACMIRWRRKL
jgi:PEP-CTERM motif